MLKPFSDEEKQETPSPKNVDFTYNIEAPVNAFDLLIKGKEDRERAVASNASSSSIDLAKIDPVESILVAAGIKAAPSESAKTAIATNAQEVFTNAGGTLEEAAKAITDVMKFDNTKPTEKLAAARLVAQIHGALENEQKDKVINVNFNVLPYTQSFAKNTVLNLAVPRN